jgi:hypothetical protein
LAYPFAHNRRNSQLRTEKKFDEDNTPDAEVREGFDRGPIRRVRQVVAYLAARNANFLFGNDTPSAPGTCLA